MALTSVGLAGLGFEFGVVADVQILLGASYRFQEKSVPTFAPPAPPPPPLWPRRPAVWAADSCSTSIPFVELLAAVWAETPRARAATARPALAPRARFAIEGGAQVVVVVVVVHDCTLSSQTDPAVVSSGHPPAIVAGDSVSVSNPRFGMESIPPPPRPRPLPPGLIRVPRMVMARPRDDRLRPPRTSGTGAVAGGDIGELSDLAISFSNRSSKSSAFLGSDSIPTLVKGFGKLRYHLCAPVERKQTTFH
jgi:hypothetical protein